MAEYRRQRTKEKLLLLVIGYLFERMEIVDCGIGIANFGLN